MGFDNVNEMGFDDDKRSTVISDGGRRWFTVAFNYGSQGSS
ncbi:uncharacterized protein G2W53_036204 [Senna tora]|uniref:Uncharacterized protein n=1 Tax=Senna tora TaxID=362788 RepID=A0A834SUK7_9FABA|nr:uncharacterized protein G2W53_036204 [Senna tora]